MGTDSSISDVLNPFLWTDLTPGIKGVDGSYTTFPVCTIYSAIDSLSAGFGGIILSSVSRTEAYALYLSYEWDVYIYASQVTLATDLISPGRTIRIYCDRLTVLPGQDGKPLKISVDAMLDTKTYPRSPDVLEISEGTPGAALDGDTIANDLNNGRAQNDWFGVMPGGHKWGLQGDQGGTIDIICNVLEIQGGLGLHLSASGGKGYPGVNGQSRNWVPPLSIGGAAGAGGQGGDGGSATIAWYTLQDEKRHPLPSAVVVTTADAGPIGDPGKPGSCIDPNNVNHSGSAAKPSLPGQGGDAESGMQLGTFDDSHPDTLNSSKTVVAVMPDLSAIAREAPMDFWRTLYHRMKLAYIENQAFGYTSSSYPQQWQTMQPFMYGAYCLVKAYSDTLLKPTTPINDDPDKAAKAAIAKAMDVMMKWYRAGKDMWGNLINYADDMSWQCKMTMISGEYQIQKDVRDLYIRLRKEFDTAIKDQDTLNALKDHAQQAVQMHTITYNALMAQIMGGGEEGIPPDQSLQGMLEEAQRKANVAQQKVLACLVQFNQAGQAFNWDITKLISGLQTFAFVLDNPAGLTVMAAATTYQFLSDGFNTLDTNNHTQISKDSLKVVDSFEGTMNEIANTAVTIGSKGDAIKDTIILGSLDQINSFVSQLTDAIKPQAQQTLDAIADFRTQIQQKNMLQVQFTNLAASAVKEYEDMLSATKTLKDLSAEPQILAQNQRQTVMNYAYMYLTQLEIVADSIAWLRRKYNYLTLTNTTNPGYVGQAAQFWTADAASYAGGENNDQELDASYMTTQQYKDQFTTWQAHQSAVYEYTPKDANSRSLFYIDVDGSTDAGAVVLKSLVSGATVVLAVTLPKDLFPNMPKPWDNRFYLFNENNFYNIRVTNIVPWIEGVQTASGEVLFDIGQGALTAIVAKGVSPTPTWYSFDHDITTSFVHKTTWKRTDQDNSAAASDMGPVTNVYIDTRGVFSQIELAFPGVTEKDKLGTNYNLKFASDVSKAFLRVEFWAHYQAYGPVVEVGDQDGDGSGTRNDKASN